MAIETMDTCGGNPFITARGAEEKLHVAYNTVVRGIGQLEAAGTMLERAEPFEAIGRIMFAPPLHSTSLTSDVRRKELRQ